MSAKSHPGDGAKRQREKGGNVSSVKRPSNSVLGLSILNNLRKLWQIVKR
jgi:hypothetical protein